MVRGCGQEAHRVGMTYRTLRGCRNVRGRLAGCRNIVVAAGTVDCGRIVIERCGRPR